MRETPGPAAVATAQDAAYGEGFDYAAGSPHLRHAAQREAIVASLQAAVAAARARTGRCRVLELGAGHGTFTASLLDAGADIVVTEMSSASAARLRERFAAEPRVRVEFDEDGDWPFRTDERFDLVACLSVLHHIPDYLRAVRRLADLLDDGGTFLSWQDPLWYPTQPRRTRGASTAAYFAWRVGRGDLRRGLATRLRRLRGVYDASKPEDMAEYHVVREGVDQKALMATLSPRFAVVGLHTYWSTQSGWLHSWGERGGLENTFALYATDCLPGGAVRGHQAMETAAEVVAGSVVEPALPTGRV